MATTNGVTNDVKPNEGGEAVDAGLAEWEKIKAGDVNQGYLSNFSAMFDKNVVNKKENLDAALRAISHDASSPEALANYQAKLAEYTLYRNAQSNAVKAYKDVDANTIRNFN